MYCNASTGHEMPRKDSRLHHQPIDGTILYIGSILSTTYMTCTAELCWSDTHGRNSRLLAKSGSCQGICITLLWFFTDDILLHIESVECSRGREDVLSCGRGISMTDVKLVD